MPTPNGNGKVYMRYSGNKHSLDFLAPLFCSFSYHFPSQPTWENHMPTLAQLTEEYLAGPQALRQAIAGLNGEQLVAHPVPGK